MQHEGFGGGELAERPLAVREEFQFAQMIVAAMEPDIKPMWTSPLFAEARRDNQSVGLNRAIDSRYVGTNHETSGNGPGCLAIFQRLGSLQALPEESSRLGKFIGAEELTIAERPINRFMENLNVRKAFEQLRAVLQTPAQFRNLTCETVRVALQPRASFVGNRNAGRRRVACGTAIRLGGETPKARDHQHQNESRAHEKDKRLTAET